MAPTSGKSDRPAGVESPPSSLWPDTGRLRAGSAHSIFEASRFDPLFEQHERERQQLSNQLDLCRPALALRVIVWVQWLVALAALPLARSATDALARGAMMAFAGLAASLLWLSVACALRGRLLAWSASAREGALAALGSLSALAAQGLLMLVGWLEPTLWHTLGTALCGASLAVMLWRHLGLRAQAAQPVEARARLAELQSRIRPHFLFNALNTAVALVQIDPHKAETMLEDLAQLFRVALAEPGSAVTLHEEIDLAQRYLAIEKLRFGDRLRVDWDLDPDADAALLPPLVLQPLVENAVRHGVEPASHGGHVRVRTRLKRGMVRIEVINSLPDEPGPAGSGIALANVSERLRLLHDLAATLDTQVKDGRFHARIMVPL